MASINTNVAAMTALRSLTATNSALTQTQERISTGLRVATAADNAAYWSIATTMKSDNSSLSTVQDALGLGAAFVDVAYTALDEAKKLKAGGTLTEDGLRDLEQDVQKLTDKFVHSIDDQLKHKESEVMKV